MRLAPLRRVVAVTVLVLAACERQPPAPTPVVTASAPAAATSSSTTTTLPARPGAAGIGDPLYPRLGNGGYDVAHYDLRLQVDSTAGTLHGVARIRASGLHPLSSFHLDLLGLTVERLTVDGAEAGFAREERELVVTPTRPLPTGATFTVEVVYGGNPQPAPLGPVPFAAGWQHVDDLVYVMSQPDGASGWFPANDHPADPATFTLEVTAPPGEEAISSGERSRHGDTHLFRIDHAVAPYMVPLAVGELQRRPEQGFAGVEAETWWSQGVEERRLEPLRRQGEIVAYLSEIIGPYPYERVGAIVVDDPGLPAALETVELATYTSASLGLGEAVVAHEIAHQWFGNAVAVARWDDIWLNEGLATYLHWRWLGERQGEAAFDREVEQAYRLIAGWSMVVQGADPEEAQRRARRAYPPPDHPPADDLFNASVYQRGALTLVAVEDAVGRETVDQVLAEHYRRHRGERVTSEDFLAVVEAVAGSSTRRLVEDWVGEPTVPSLPARGLYPPVG